LPSGIPATSPTNVTPSAAPPAVSPSTGDQSAASTDKSLLQQNIQNLEQQIALAQQERQSLLEALKAVRPVRMNPAFGRERRQVDELGRALAAVEMRLDALYAEWQEAMQQLHAEDDSTTAAATAADRQVLLDNQGHDQAYWRQRLVPLRERLQEARQQRQSILQRLGAELSDERDAFGRRGREVLSLVAALEQLDQEIHQTEMTLHILRREAASAGAPAAWLQ
jgi:chromosome segregation ATPase